MTIRSVQIGPRNKDTSHQARPLLPLHCARPALMRDKVSQPTAYCPVDWFITGHPSEVSFFEFAARPRAYI